MYCAIVVWLPLMAAEMYNKNNVRYFTFYCYYLAILNVTFKKNFFYYYNPSPLVLRVTKSPPPSLPARTKGCNFLSGTA